MSIGHSSSAYSLPGGEPERERQRGGDDDELPPPEVDPAEQVAEHPRLAEPLEGVVDPHEDRVPDEGEDHGVGVERAEAAVRGEGQSEVRRRVKQIDGDQQAHEHAHHAPDDGGNGELLDDPVVV